MFQKKLFWRIYIIVAWYDFWIGAYYNDAKQRLYIMIPWVGIYIDFSDKNIPIKDKEFIKEQKIKNNNSVSQLPGC